jgi:hypothetical protein
LAAGPRRRGLALALAILVILAGGAAGAFFLLRSGRSPGSVTKPTATSAPPRTPFEFQVDRVSYYSLKRKSARKQSAQAAGAIAEQLSGFYDTAFADPASWKAGVPDDAWNVFARSVRDDAKGEAGSFTPAVTGMDLVTLHVTKSSLAVTVMFDAAGRPQAAFAKVEFEGAGELKGGQEVEVDNGVTFFLRPASGNWLIAGYPEAETTIDAGTPSPGPSASPSAGSSP